VKKLISIGVALALLTMAVVPGAVAADLEPDTYPKIPFAIIGSALELAADLWAIMDTPEGLDIGMPWIGDVLDLMAPWAVGPLAWTVDMLAWGVGLGSDVLTELFKIDLISGALPEGVGDALTGVLDVVACGLLTPWSDNITGTEFNPCEGL